MVTPGLIWATTEIDSSTLDNALSSGWLIVVGGILGVLLVVIALAVGGRVQARAARRDETRKAQLAAEAEHLENLKNRVNLDEIDLTGIGVDGTPLLKP